MLTGLKKNIKMVEKVLANCGINFDVFTFVTNEYYRNVKIAEMRRYINNLETKDAWDFHANGVTELCMLTAKKIQHDDPALKIAAEHHDDGKAFMNEILLSGRRFTPEEREMANCHALLSALMNWDKGFKVMFLILCHHDTVNGTGANKLKLFGTSAKILRACDIAHAIAFVDDSRDYQNDNKTEKRDAMPLTKVNKIMNEDNDNKQIIDTVMSIVANMRNETLAKA